MNVPSAEEFARPRTRRDFFKTLAAASAGAAVGGMFISKKAQAQIGGSQEGDAGIFNFALTLEFLERDFYQMALDRGVLSGPALGVVTNLRDHEFAHAEFLTSAGGDPSAVPGFVFPPESLASQEGVLALAATLEPVGVGAYLGAAPLISDPSTLEAALSIYGTEADHVVAVNNLIGVYPPAQTAFETPISAEAALAAAAPFLASGGSSGSGGSSSSPSGTSISAGGASASAG